MLELLFRGMANKEIYRELDTVFGTVKVYVAAICRDWAFLIVPSPRKLEPSTSRRTRKRDQHLSSPSRSPYAG
jgi:FixJ family two-component response regulator